MSKPTDSAHQIAKPTPRWLQFTLRMMLAALVVAAAGFGYWRYSTQEERAILAIEELGGTVADLEQEGETFRGVRCFGGDRGLAQIPYVTAVNTLIVDHHGVTDAGMAALSDLQDLEILSLQNSAITDQGVKHLAGLHGLKLLSLGETLISDKALAHLGGMSELSILDLSFTRVTDAGLEHLHALKSLTEVHLDNTQVTDAGVDALQTALPNLRIER